MIENQIRTWVEEQLALGEDPEILRQTLLELDIDEDEVMAVIPKNTVKQENHTNDFKTEQEKVMKQIIPELSTPPKPGKNIHFGRRGGNQHPTTKQTASQAYDPQRGV